MSHYVLVVEDDEWLAQQHVRIIKQAGMSAASIGDAAGAMAMIDKRPPDSIVLDLLLTGQTAFVLLHELRSHADLAAIPIVVCTNSAGDIASEDLEVYGVGVILDKTTMHPRDLVAAIRKVLP